MTKISEQVLLKLSRFDTPTICNIIELFDYQPRTAGYMDVRIAANFPECAPMVGFAATAMCHTGHAPRGIDVYGSMADQVERFEELEGPPVVVFQDLGDPIQGATFGELMCATYQHFGAVGLITNGPGRDLDQVQARGFPVFTNGAVCSHGYIHITAAYVPVQVGGLTVFPGDLLHGDRNGVIRIPLELASDVADAGEAFVAAEQVVLDALLSESLSVAQLREAIGESKSQISALSQRLRAH